ncbi:MAG: replicative DNA helicase [bacterium]
MKKMPVDKLPPQNIDAEISVLGAMLIEKEAIGKTLEILNSKDFYKDAHKKIFSAIVSLYDKDEAVDLVTLTEHLTKGKELKDAGGPSYISGLVSSVATAANVEHHARIVKQKATLRNLINVSTQIITKSYEGNEEVDVILDRAEKLIFEVSQQKMKGEFVAVKSILKDTFQTIENIIDKKIHVTGIRTGFDELDDRTAGLQNSDLIIVAGRPSMGKTSFALSLAHHIGVEEKIPIGILSLEMSKEQLVQRMLCSEARVDMHKMRTGYLGEQDWPKLTIAAGRLSEAPIYIDDSSNLSGLEVRAKARRLKATKNIGILIIDYLQLMSGKSGSENRQQEISEISRSLKGLAKELNIPVVALSQLRRLGEGRHRPQLSDLRESGAIEQDADVVLLLVREELYEETEENKGEAEINIGKQRNGPTGLFKLAFIKEYAKFENLSMREDEE